MTYQIIGDSCLDLTSGMREDARFGTVPLTLQVGDETVVDDESFNQAKFLAMVRACPQCPKTACPSPELFLERYRKAGTDVVFVITLSCHLSGSYNSAMTAKQIYDEEQKAGTGPSTRVEVIDSLSASSGPSAFWHPCPPQPPLRCRKIPEPEKNFLKLFKISQDNA